MNLLDVFAVLTQEQLDLSRPSPGFVLEYDLCS